MNFSEIQYRNISTSSLSVGSKMTEEDLMFFTDGNTSTNFPFGKSDKDFLKLSVFNFDESTVTGSAIYAGGNYVSYTQSFYDVYNKYTTYSYKTFNSDWPIFTSETSSLFFDVSKELNSLNVLDGNYKIIIELFRNVVGSDRSPEDKLMVDSISPNRDEITVIPKTLNGTDSQISRDFEIFSNSEVQIKDIASDILSAIGSPQIYNIYYKAKEQDPTGSAAFKYYYGFTQRNNENNNDIDAISFITDLYYGVKKGNIRNNGQIATNDILGIYDQFKNLLYQNYELGTTFQDVYDYYYSLFNFIVNQELNRLTNSKPDNYDSVVKFLEIIYYNLIFYPKVNDVEVKYNTDLAGYFKNYINFNSGESFSLLNKKVIPATDSRYYNKLALKLDRPLPLGIVAGDDVWITNDFGFLPIVQNLYYFTKPYIKTIPLRGPNFLARIESQGNSTEALSMEQLINQTGSQYNEILSKLTAPSEKITDNTNYREFSNFVNFSSAELRISAFNSKNQQIKILQEALIDLDKKLELNPTDQFYLKEKTDFNNQIDQIEANMDGYEKFLYNNPIWYAEHDASASMYDKENRNSLINNLPQFIIEDHDQNQDYIVFVGMIGHFFDNISLAIKQITEKNNCTTSTNYGISVDIVEDMLASLGWEAEISKDNLPILLSSFNKNEFDIGSDLYNNSRSVSEEERNRIIWKRILNSLPYIYKTKGTEASLSALLSCFGIPKNIIKIKEYGGIHKVQNLTDTSLYVIDEVKYEPYFSGSGEYFKLNWTGSAQTLEFNFSFDPSKTSTEGQVFRLINCSDYWAIGVYRDRGNDWGRLFFSIEDGFGNTKTIMTDKAPVFDGSTYHAMIRRNDPVSDFGIYNFLPSQEDNYPIKYDLRLQRASDARITFDVNASQYLSGSFNLSFKDGTYVYIGNYNQNTGSLNFDPEAFFGNIDEIKIWESSIHDDTFESHTLHQNAYDLNSPQVMIYDNLARVSFERPLDLSDSSNIVALNNLAFRKDFPTFDAINFPKYYSPLVQLQECDPVSGSIFPWQFTRKDTRQTVKIPEYGSNKFKSNKINYVEQELPTSLSPSSRSSKKSSELTSVDSNKLGIFFSPSEIQNSEIIKFFGEYPLSDLIGDPGCVYENSYKKFEKFKQIFYNQGFGAIDYQFFMNVVRFYFDKAMFKYIKSTVPARARLVDGILIEPSILERPKLQSKPIVQETIHQKEADVLLDRGVYASKFPSLSTSVAIKNSGTTILNDVNHRFFPEDEDHFGFGVFAVDGITYYKNDYYRADEIKIKKEYQVHNKYNLQKSELNDYEKNVNLDGTVQTVTSSYYKINMTKLPFLTTFDVTASVAMSSSFGYTYFSGSVDFVPPYTGINIAFSVSSSHHISGVVSGVIVGSGSASDGYISSPGMKLQAKYDSTYPINYKGTFTYSYPLDLYYFEGTIDTGVTPPSLGFTKFNMTFSSLVEGTYIFDEFKYRTSGTFFGAAASSNNYRKRFTMRNYPKNATLLNGYYTNHYKYTNQQFSIKEINAYDNKDNGFKWKKGSQNKKTTVDPTTGLLDNSEPVETKTV